MSKLRGVLRWISRGLLRLVIWGAAVVTAAYLCSVWYVPPLVERALARRFPDAAVAIQGARFSGVGVLVKGATIAEDEDSLAVSPVFFAERVWVEFAPAELLRRRVVVRSAVVRDAVLTAEYEKGRGWNIERLGTQADDAPTERLPVVRIERGAVRVRQNIDGQATPIATVGVNGHIVETGTRQYEFLFQADERFAMSGSRLEGTVRIGENEHKNELALMGWVRMPQRRILDNAWNLDDIVLECAFDADGVDVHRLGFRMGQGVGAASGRLDFTRDGAFDVSAELAGFAISDTPAVDTVVYSDAAMELLGPWAEGFLRRYRPRGLGDVELRLRGRWDRMEQTDITGQVVCRDITVEDARFPYELERMEGVIAFSGRSLMLDSLSCRHGDSELVIEGYIEDFGPEMEIRLRVVSGKIRFDEDVYRALGPETKKMWFAFSPSGTGAIDHTYQRFADGRRTRRLAVELIDTGAMFEHFPYPLEHLTGQLVFEPNVIILSHVEAHYADERMVRIDGQVRGADEYSLRVRAERIPVDERLIGALPPVQQNFLKHIELDAVLAADMQITADETGQLPFDYTAHLEITGKRLVYAGFAVPLEEVRIVADVTQEVIDLRELRGCYGDGHLLLSGQIVTVGRDEAAPGLYMEVEMEKFALDEVFWAAAEGRLPLSPDIRLSGPVEVRGRWSRNMPAASAPMDITVVCRANPLTVGGQAAGRATGLMRLEEGRVRLEAFEIDELLLSDSLAGAMPERMKRMYERLGLTGRIDAAISRADLVWDEQGFGGIEAFGRVHAENVKTQTSTVIEHLNGVINGRIRLDADERVQDIEAIYRAEEFDLWGRRVDTLSGRLVYEPNEGVLASRNFTAELGQGIATGSVTVDIANETSLSAYTVGLNFEGIPVNRLVASPTSESEDEPAQRGQATGTLNVQGRLDQTESAEGQLSAMVSKMRLGRQSLIGRMLTAIQFREPKDYVFNRMEIEAFLMGNTVVIDRVRIEGRPFVFHGDGRFDLKANRLEMDLVALGGLAGTEPFFLDSLLRGLGAAFWKIEVRGDLAEPEIRTISLPILQLPLELLRR